MFAGAGPIRQAGRPPDRFAFIRHPPAAPVYTRRGLPGERETDNKGSGPAFRPFRAVSAVPGRFQRAFATEYGRCFVFGINNLAESTSVEVSLHKAS